jgi:hypothetical protein
MRLWRVAAAATALLLVALVVVLSQSRHHGTGTNGAAPNALKPLPAGKTLCQPRERMEAGTARVGFRPFERGPEVPFKVSVPDPQGGPPLAGGSVPPRHYEKGEDAVARLSRTIGPVADVTVCVTNDGDRDTMLYGQGVGRADSSDYQPIGGFPEPWVRIRLDYSQRSERSWWSFAPTAAERYGLIKATFLGSWTMWVVLAALLALALGAIWYAARAMAR